MHTFFRYISLCLLCGILIGCSSYKPQYGNFTEGTPAYNQTMALDAADEIARYYPPAQTTFILQEPVQDEFGHLFISMLREKGFAIKDVNSMQNSDPIVANTLALAYTVDSFSETSEGQFYVFLYVENDRFARLYQAGAGQLTPLGVWTKRGNDGEA